MEPESHRFVEEASLPKVHFQIPCFIFACTGAALHMKSPFHKRAAAGGDVPSRTDLLQLAATGPCGAQTLPTFAYQ